jgi:hypothetical protein
MVTIIFLLRVPFIAFNDIHDGADGEKLMVHTPFDCTVNESDALTEPAKERLETFAEMVVGVSSLGDFSHPDIKKIAKIRVTGSFFMPL